MNVTHLMGRLTADPELSQTGGGQLYSRFRIAVSRSREKTDFFNIVAWEKTAEFVSKYFKKGERIIVYGSIRNSNYTDKDGKQQYSVEIIADKLEFVDTLASKEAAKTPETPAHTKETTLSDTNTESKVKNNIEKDYIDYPS